MTLIIVGGSMKTININYSKNTVKLFFGNNIINKNWDLLDITRNYFVITDQNINKLYNDLIKSIPNLKGICSLVPGENTKSIETYHMIITLLQTYNITKNDVIIALGGGVITDIAGMVAGTYKRGIDFINIPTSLIGMVDASIGGKCGININEFKNQVGLFYHPLSIIIDTNWLTTLPQLEFTSGMAEIIKMAIITDEKMYNELNKLPKDDINNINALSELIYQAIIHKVKIVEKDEFDIKKRHILNFGHTIGHLIESESSFTITHGEAVARGMVAEIGNKDIETSLINLLKKYNLLTDKINKSDYLKSITSDKKYHNGHISLVEIPSIGHAKIKKYNLETLTNEQFWKEY